MTFAPQASPLWADLENGGTLVVSPPRPYLLVAALLRTAHWGLPMADTQSLAVSDSGVAVNELGPAIHLDHCVIHVTDWDRATAFYRDVVGAEVIPAGKGVAFRFGGVQLNVHGPGQIGSILADKPVMPGNSDLCFRWSGPIEDAVAHLAKHGVPVELGPVERRGAAGLGVSVYFRDPDGSLMEFITYPTT